MPKPNKADWGKYKEVARASTSNWNALVDLPKVFKKEFTWLNEFDLGFFVDEDVTERMSLGWRWLEMVHFDYETIDSFNAMVGTRFGLSTDAAGHLKWRNNFLMIRPRELTDEIVRERNRIAHERAIIPPPAHAVKGDPRENEVLEYSREHSEYEQTKVNRDTGAQQKRQGRPPKE